MSTPATTPSEPREPAAARPPLTVLDPATGATITQVPDLGAADVAAHVERARVAQVGWAATSPKERARLLYAWQQWLIAHRQEVVDVIVRENGKTREDALLAEIFYLVDALGHWAKVGPGLLADTKVKPHSPLLAGRSVHVAHRPLGVVGVIGPWNYPLTNCVGDAIPALMAGNSVVLKPSDVTPLAAMRLAEAAREVGFPEHVLSVATGGGETGAALVDTADMIMFTGSTATGRKIAARCGERLIPCSLELGGKDPLIVLDDADVARAANVAVEWSMRNSGQVCLSVERVYVMAAVYDEFVKRVTEQVGALRQGAPQKAASVDVGAITHAPQLDLIEGHVQDAVNKGARVLVGGHRAPGPGQFFEPTVLVDVDHSMACMTDETFGPTLPIMRVESEEEAIRLANDSPYGLSSSVFTKDLDRGRRVAAQLQAGSTLINDAIMHYLAIEAPMGGAKDSGVGVRHGAEGLLKYTQPHTVVVTHRVLRKELTMFPNARLRGRLLDGLIPLMFARRRRR